MATVSNVTLQIGREEGDRRRVTVNYRICFSGCEALAGSTFVEKVTLRGDDPIWDDHLITLRNACVKAERGCVDRSVSTMVSESTLDEDGDTIILGWVINRDRDEIYARVTLVPFAPTGSEADSNIVTGQFGPD
ncbi:hypothetical protein LZ016_11365 [Sphingomonas sp. SM33]|uniref:C2 domain-containing protein n=1 Tax=Sphingomonas telluris TaxID=2907998 RepID=A0ABS9VNY5_9SPHN|nr:hypothetical protein [Sphingomonas telluris]MCH8616695.1 hypothetical protein [Sphingomonas telluris]